MMPLFFFRTIFLSLLFKHSEKSCETIFMPLMTVDGKSLSYLH